MKKFLKQFFYIFILIILIIILFIIFKYENYFFKNIDLKVCLCIPAKKENKYIREFIQYYENYGIDKIFLYDNNDINGEKFDVIIKDYIIKGLVQVLNWRGKKKILIPFLNDCYKRNYKEYNWLVFYEIDEYIHLKNFRNIKQYLKNPKFKKCQTINLNWVFHTDNNKINYENKSLFARFPELERNAQLKRKGCHNIVKSILKGNISNIYLYNTHFLSKKLIGCNGFGNIHKLIGQKMINNDYEYYYIDHFYSKSLEEYVEKINKGCSHFSQSKKYKISRIKIFFTYNKITLEKINYIEKNTGLNLSKYKIKINSSNL